MADLCEGAQLLREFIRSHGLADAAAAAAIGVSAPTMHEWLSGTYRPRVEHRRAIEKWTSAYVPESAWQTAEERETAEGIKAFTPLTGPAIGKRNGTDG